jgi:hypothetical protein
MACWAKPLTRACSAQILRSQVRGKKSHHQILNFQSRVHIPHHVFLILQLSHILRMLCERVTGLEEHGRADINAQIHPMRFPD